MQRPNSANLVGGGLNARTRWFLALPLGITMALFAGGGCSSGNYEEPTGAVSQAVDECYEDDDCFPYRCVFDAVYGNWCMYYCRNPSEPEGYCHPDAYCWESEPICSEEPEFPWEDPGTCAPYAYADPCPTECFDDDDCFGFAICEYSPGGNVCD